LYKSSLNLHKVRHYSGTPHAGVPLPARILVISHIAEMQGEFANTLMMEMRPDNSSKIKIVE
jgi:hypothetical protein